MAGKHVGGMDGRDGVGTALVGFEWNPRTSRAYEEGRRAGTNFHAAGSDAAIATANGLANLADGTFQFETAVP